MNASREDIEKLVAILWPAQRSAEVMNELFPAWHFGWDDVSKTITIEESDASDESS